MLLVAGPEETKEPSGENVLRLIQDPFNDAESDEHLVGSSSTIAAVWCNSTGLLTILNRLRCRFVQFKLCAHFL